MKFSLYVESKTVELPSRRSDQTVHKSIKTRYYSRSFPALTSFATRMCSLFLQKQSLIKLTDK